MQNKDGKRGLGCRRKRHPKNLGPRKSLPRQLERRLDRSQLRDIEGRWLRFRRGDLARSNRHAINRTRKPEHERKINRDDPEPLVKVAPSCAPSPSRAQRSAEEPPETVAVKME